MNKKKCTVTTMVKQSACISAEDGDTRAQILENPPHITENIETESAIDWISKLPDSLIVQILSLTPVKDAYKTTVLSKRWQNLWTCIDSLILDSSETNCDISDFVSFTDSVLSRLSCPKIQNFSLGFYPGVSYYSKVDKWLEFAANKNVENLDLRVRYAVLTPCNLPQLLCSSSSIVKLELTFCRIPEECVLNWTSLKHLTLKDLFIRDEHIEQIASSCPQLESLKLRNFCGFRRLLITSPRCRRLELINHRHPIGEWGSFGGDCCFEIVAPYVQHLKISGEFHGAKIRLGDLSALLSADVTFSVDKVIDKSIVKNHLVSLRCADELMVPSWYIEVISMLMLEKEDVSLPLLECKRLKVNTWIAECSFPGIANLLRSTPYLENLTVVAEGYDSFIDYGDQDTDLLGHNSLSLEENIFQGSLQNLKTAKVISAFCVYDMIDLPELLKSLLRHAINLEKLVIETEHRSCDYCSTKISKMIQNLLSFPRASGKAVVLTYDCYNVDNSKISVCFN